MSKHSFRDKITSFYMRKIKKWMFCPNCNNDKLLFNKHTNNWSCANCGYSISREEYENDYVFWFCNECNSFLNNQSGFNDTNCKHICTNCGYENDITEDNIKGICKDCGKILNDKSISICTECKSIRQQKQKKWLIATGTIIGAAIAVSGVAYIIVKLSKNKQVHIPISNHSTVDDKIVISNIDIPSAKTIYITKEYDGYGKQHYYRNEYKQVGDKIFKYRHHRQKFFNGEENVWNEYDKLIETWDINDPNMPDWLSNRIKEINNLS